jgi:NTP pyrophosphatase (non-canonical NTP hydrolase)
MQPTTDHEKDLPAELLKLAESLLFAGNIPDHNVIMRALGVVKEATTERKIALDPRDQAAEYLVQLRRFTSSNSFPRDLASRTRKAAEELGELSEAVVLEAMFGGRTREIREEAADFVNVGMDILLITGGDGPDAMLSVYPWLNFNLLEKATKYERGENRIGGRH